MPRLTDAQLQERGQGLGASDMAVLAGVSPYQTPFELYLEKIGELDRTARMDQVVLDSMERGHRLEDVALEWDRDRTGDPFWRVKGTVWHPTLPWGYCHPDATRHPFGRLDHLVEVKTAARPWKEVPQHVEVQVMWQMACTGATQVDVLLLTFQGPPERYRVERDDLLVHALEGLGAAFWRRVEDRDPPPVDGSDGASRWLDNTRWRNEPELLAEPGQRDLLVRLIDCRTQAKELEKLDAELVNQLKFSMGGSRLYAPGVGRVLWTAPHEKRTTKWKEVAGEFRIMIQMAYQASGDELPDLDEVELQHTTVDPDARSFTVKPEGDTA